MRVTIWLDYGLDGWRPKEFETEAAALEFIRGGETYGNGFRVTRDLELRIGEAKG